MNKKVLLLLLPLLGMCCWAMYYAYFVQNAVEVILPVRGYDPRNLLSGHYIEFQIDWGKADCYQANWNGICPRNDFIGVNRFYVPENMAKKLERLINSSQSNAKVSFAYQKGARPVAKMLLINDKSWQQYH